RKRPRAASNGHVASSEIGARLDAVRRRMTAAGIDVLLVRSTDRYLNEYVPAADSTRVWLTGFTGSMGEVAVAKDRAYLAVDARLVQRLDEIAYLTNLRGDELPYQATFKAIALVTPERVHVGRDPARVPDNIRTAQADVVFVPAAELWSMLARHKRVGYDK